MPDQQQLRIRQWALTVSVMGSMAVGSIALLVQRNNLAIAAFLFLAVSAYVLGGGDD